MSIDGMIDALIEREGGYVDHPADRGGPTRWGITEVEARASGYDGAIRALPQTIARGIYWRRFVVAPGIDLLAKRSPRIAAEALDTGVNMGAPWGVMMLQRALNAFNSGGTHWGDIKVDGNYGGRADAALAACMTRRSRDRAEDVVLAAMNAQQGDRYLDIIDRNASQEAFAWGWFRTRVLEAAI